MTQVEVRSIRSQQKRHALYVSAGDRETFATHALDRLSDTFDILIFQYGTSPTKRARFRKDSIVFATGSGTKFNALKEIFRQHPEMLLRYETILVCDDDLVPETGDLRLLPVAAMALGIAVLSPAHSIQGKISHEIMLPVPGRHFLRYTSFVEMSFPLFRTEALVRFLDAYDGSLQGFGDDWWFLNILQADKKAVAALVDGVTVINPHNHHKPGGYGEIELLGTRDAITDVWLEAKDKRGMREWSPRTLFYVRPEPAGTSTFGLAPCTFGAILRIVLASWNYALRFYPLRNRLHRRLRGAGPTA